MLIRGLKSSDRTAIHQILQETNIFTAEEIDIAMELVDDCLHNNNSAFKVDVAVDDQKDNMILGYACYGKSSLSYSTYDLYWIAVKPHVQKRGVGKALLKHVENEVKKEKGTQIILDTASKKSYDATRKFYECMGYNKIAVIEDFYAPGDSKIIYYKKLL